MPQRDFVLTPEGLAKLEAELDYLRRVRRPEVAEKIQRAKEMGGTVNNAEYDDAKNDQAFVEGRILTLENMIKRAQVIEHADACSQAVALGCKVTLRNQDGKPEIYYIVGSAEANPNEGRISNESPVGRALMGKKMGDEVEIKVPAGVLRLTITKIE